MSAYINVFTRIYAYLHVYTRIYRYIRVFIRIYGYIRVIFIICGVPFPAWSVRILFVFPAFLEGTILLYLLVQLIAYSPRLILTRKNAYLHVYTHILSVFRRTLCVLRILSVLPPRAWFRPPRATCPTPGG